MSTDQAEQLVEKALAFPSIQKATEFLRSTPISNYSYHNEAHTLDVMHEVALFRIRGTTCPKRS